TLRRAKHSSDEEARCFAWRRHGVYRLPGKEEDQCGGPEVGRATALTAPRAGSIISNPTRRGPPEVSPLRSPSEWCQCGDTNTAIVPAPRDTDPSAYPIQVPVIVNERSSSDKGFATF